MNEKNLIDIKSGAYYVSIDGEQRQEVNEYSITQGEESKKRKKREKKKIDEVESKNENTNTVNSNAVNDKPDRFKYYDIYYHTKDIEENVLHGKYLNEEDYVFVQEYKDLVNPKVKKAFDNRFAAMKKSEKDFTVKKIREWEANYKKWKYNKSRDELLEEYGIIMKLKDGSYLPIKEDEDIDIQKIRECDVIIFRGTYTHQDSSLYYSEGIENYISEVKSNIIYPANYVDNELKTIIKRILTEGNSIDINFYKQIKDNYAEKQNFEYEEYIKRRANLPDISGIIEH
jgi:hypothetical protein